MALDPLTWPIEVWGVIIAFIALIRPEIARAISRWKTTLSATIRYPIEINYTGLGPQISLIHSVFYRGPGRSLQNIELHVRRSKDNFSILLFAYLEKPISAFLPEADVLKNTTIWTPISLGESASFARYTIFVDPQRLRELQKGLARESEAWAQHLRENFAAGLSPPDLMQKEFQKFSMRSEGNKLYSRIQTQISSVWDVGTYVADLIAVDFAGKRIKMLSFSFDIVEEDNERLRIHAAGLMFTTSRGIQPESRLDPILCEAKDQR